MLDIDKEVAETVVETPAEEEQAPAETTDTTTVDKDNGDAVRKENERIKKANKALNEKLKRLEAEREAAEPEAVDSAPEEQAANDDPLATREGWMNEIDKRSEAKAKALVAPIYESNFRRAKDRFLKLHPEYGTDKEKLKAILSAAQAGGKVDEEEILETMGQAWASTNWRKLQEDSMKRETSRQRAQAATVSAAGASESSDTTEEYSEAEREEAAKFGKSVEVYRKAKQALEASTFNVTN